MQSAEGFGRRVAEAYKLKEAKDSERWTKETAADGQLYDGFIGNGDKIVSRDIRHADPSRINEFEPKLHDLRLKELLPLYKARNYPDALSDEERQEWESFIKDRLMAGGPNGRLAKFFGRLQELAATDLDADKRYLLEELQLYGQSIMPADLD